MSTIRSTRSSYPREPAHATCASIATPRARASKPTTASHSPRVVRQGGDTVWMQPPFYCDYGIEHRPGRTSLLQFQLHCSRRLSGTIGDFTLFGPAVQIYTLLHPFNAEQRRREEFGKPVEIGSAVSGRWRRDHSCWCTASALVRSLAREALSHGMFRKECSWPVTRAR